MVQKNSTRDGNGSISVVISTVELSDKHVWKLFGEYIMHEVYADILMN